MLWQRNKLYVVLMALIITHQSYLWLPCYTSYFGFSCWANDTFEEVYPFFLSFFGFILIVVSINGSLRTTHDMSLHGYFKNKIPPNPFREIKPINVNESNVTITVAKPKFDGIGMAFKDPETIDDLHDILKQQNIAHKNMVHASEQRIGERIENLRQEVSPEAHAALKNTFQLQEKLKTVVITSIDGQLVGSLLVLYAAYINL